ncbi:hypothetical protein EDEG_00193 [Edhazardia aedis USNM 41457]|uniref:Uncharacterized protein n=1 Tax=Edhazardia aedis (strain USNM 41457) TaxID=1003232 RepID=J9DQP1_EDHAE|nr:hypothetical protein EDEG_00193 [Edhazardia aedis USNM 41457]|eukprot:EJW03632.1 hypothetical protein EDEG_00193 [Edhazardia aedis USNM 41457]
MNKIFQKIAKNKDSTGKGGYWSLINTNRVKITSKPSPNTKKTNFDSIDLPHDANEVILDVSPKETVQNSIRNSIKYIEQDKIFEFKD